MERNRHKILWIYGRANAFAGSFLSLLEILQRVDRSAFDVTVHLPGTGNCSEEFAALGVPVLCRRPTPTGKTLRYLQAAWSFRRLLRRERIELVYFADYATWRPPELVGARWAQVPVVAHFRFPMSAAFAGDRWLGSSAAIIGNSAATLRSFRGQVPDTALHVVYNFIDFDRFGPGPDLRGTFFPAGHPLIGFVGTFRREKGLEYFLDMARILRTNRPELRYLLVGGPSPAGSDAWWEAMQRRAAEIGVADVAHFTGPRTDIPAIMRSLDVLVVPSLNEGFGRVILEANAVGTPVIGTNFAGIPEVIEDGVTGILTPPRDAAAMARAVVHILDDTAWRARVAATAPARVRERFSPARQVRMLEDIWRNAISVSDG